MFVWGNIVNFLLYLAVSLPLLFVGIFLFMLVTPYKEYKIIADAGDGTNICKAAAAQAAALDLGGKIFGLGLVLASAIFHSVNILSLAIWGVIGMVFQVFIYYLFEWITPFDVRSEIPKGNISVGIMSAFISAATGLIMAALIS